MVALLGLLPRSLELQSVAALSFLIAFRLSATYDLPLVLLLSRLTTHSPWRESLLYQLGVSRISPFPMTGAER